MALSVDLVNNVQNMFFYDANRDFLNLASGSYAISMTGSEFDSDYLFYFNAPEDEDRMCGHLNE